MKVADVREKRCVGVLHEIGRGSLTDFAEMGRSVLRPYGCLHGHIACVCERPQGLRGGPELQARAHRQLPIYFENMRTVLRSLVCWSRVWTVAPEIGSLRAGAISASGSRTKRRCERRGWGTCNSEVAIILSA